MDLATWICKLPRKIWFQKRSTSGFFLDEQSLRLEMARERMRVDRNGSPLAILTIDLPAGAIRSLRDFDFLGRVLAGRLRITDSIGFLSTKQVGVLLPDTSKSGAWKVATDVCAVYPPGHDRPNCDVFTYPDDSNDKRWASSDSSDQQELPTHESGEAVLDRFIAFRTPASKRVIDVFGASLGLLASAPMLFAIAIVIKLTSRGPAFYSQEREGLGGRRFRIYKFRTMRLDADRMQAQLRQYSEQDGPAFKMSARSTHDLDRPLAAENQHGRAAAAVERAARRHVARRTAAAADRRIAPMLALAAPASSRAARPHLHLANLGPQHRPLRRVDADGSAIRPPAVIPVRHRTPSPHSYRPSFCSAVRDKCPRQILILFASHQEQHHGRYTDNPISTLGSIGDTAVPAQD